MKVIFCEQIFNSFGKIEQTKKNETGQDPIVITDTSEVSKYISWPLVKMEYLWQ